MAHPLINILRSYLRKPIDIKRSWVETPGRLGNMTKFLGWFDATASIDATRARAASDWARRITAFERYPAIPKRNCLEIGFGAGRLLVEASKEFQQAIGVDIHAAFDKTRDYIRLHQRTNITLLHRDELAAVSDASIDFIFSFIVFQHFDAYEEVDFYLGHIRRLLSPKGCAHIFFAKNTTPGIRVIDPRAFKERKCSLFLEPAFFREKLSKQFTVVEFQDFMKKHLDQPLSAANESEQARVVLALPA